VKWLAILTEYYNNRELACRGWCMVLGTDARGRTHLALHVGKKMLDIVERTLSAQEKTDAGKGFARVP
jgi:hypothetical protein